MKKQKLTAALLLLMTTLAMTGFAQRGLGETLTMTFLGDCTIGEQEQYRGYGYSFTGKMKKLGMDYPFSAVYDLLAEDDLTIANCEVVFTNRTRHQSKKTNLRATPEWAQVFSLGSVEVVNTSNNHTYDYYAAGRKDTLAALGEAGLEYFGDGDLAVVEVKGVTIGFTGYTYPHRGDITRQKKDIETLRGMGCDLVIVSMHWGRELNPKPTGEQLKLGPALIDAGADIVFGHGPHVLQPVQMYKGKPIFYSLANFTFGADPKPKDSDTAMLQLTYTLSEDGPVLQGLTAYPCKMHENKDYRPYVLTEEKDRERVLKKLVFSSKAKTDSGLSEDFLATGAISFGE